MIKRVLIITKYEWDEGLAGGNTLSNFFGGWEGVEFYNIYCRDALPCNGWCFDYYTVSPIDIAKHLLTPWKIGREFSYKSKDRVSNDSNIKSESTLKGLSKKNQSLFDFLYDILYGTNLWNNRNLKSYISKSNPDLVFVFGTQDVFNYRLTRYIRKHLNIPIAAYYVDDHYNKKASKLNLLNFFRKKRFMNTAKYATKCYAISQLMCEEYSRAFSKEFSLLYKGCDINEVKNTINKPIRFVYAGNLFYGRADILIELAEVIRQINVDTNFANKAHLDIYTSTKVSSAISKKLMLPGTSVVHSARPFEEIKTIMSSADIVLHVESFDKKQINSVRLSFSTKITDCIQSGVKVLAIGPDEIASIQFLRQIPGVSVITDPQLISHTVKELIINPSAILEDSIKISDYAGSNMTRENVHKRLQSDFMKISQSSS